jgi:hypothetical protein
MSTVQSLLDTLQFRVDVQADLYHIINGAIRTIAKRLYWHDSDIIRGEFSLPLYAEQSYVASTIALVDSNPDTITDSANQLVAELFKAGMLIGTNHASNPGPFTINTVAVGSIALAATDSLVAVGAGSPITITSLPGVVNLPSDFWGFCGNNDEDYPYIDGHSRVLKPLPNKATALIRIESGTPSYFKIKGRQLYLYPPTGEDITIKGDCFTRPTLVTALSDTVPFDELFDDAICEVIAMMYEKGLSTQGENSVLLRNLCNEAVDMIVPKYQQKAPVQAGGIDWDSFV